MPDQRIDEADQVAPSEVDAALVVPSEVDVVPVAPDLDDGEPDLAAPGPPPTGRRLAVASLTALGIVYGDIGTSPIYALKECFRGRNAVAVTPFEVLGVLSLIFWSLIIVISLKYLAYIMRAHNRGEGGILALVSLLHPWGGPEHRRRPVLLALGIFGAALLYGDGIITPAISVLSAVEGLSVATDALTHLVVPLTAGILIVLFLFQRRGTADVGRVFGPVMVVWFATLAVLGVASIAQTPSVLAAIWPGHAVRFFATQGATGFFMLGTVFLVVTGGEALYADMGHIGVRPIRVAWFGLVLPALVLNYFGQGALILRNPADVAHPFYHLAPSWALYPLVGLATVATIIASQAVITGAFSLTWQAMQFGELPPFRTVHTSEEKAGQIYIPAINWALMVATLTLVFTFRASSNLAAAYGVAITTTMVITTILAWHVSREIFGWSWAPAALLTALLLVVDCAFLGANLLKIPDGGYVPLVIACVVFLLMATWRRGSAILADRLAEKTVPLDDFLARLESGEVPRVPGTAVFLTTRVREIPAMLKHEREIYGVVHERVVLVTVVTEGVPRVPRHDRVEVEALSSGVYRVALHFGFIQRHSVPTALRLCKKRGLNLDLATVSYHLQRENLFATKRPGMALWRERLFAFMARNVAGPTDTFALPPAQVVELGLQVEL